MLMVKVNANTHQVTLSSQFSHTKPHAHPHPKHLYHVLLCYFKQNTTQQTKMQMQAKTMQRQAAAR
jgi:hypothetical protein